LIVRGVDPQSGIAYVTHTPKGPLHAQDTLRDLDRQRRGLPQQVLARIPPNLFVGRDRVATAWKIIISHSTQTFRGILRPSETQAPHAPGNGVTASGLKVRVEPMSHAGSPFSRTLRSHPIRKDRARPPLEPGLNWTGGPGIGPHNTLSRKAPPFRAGAGYWHLWPRHPAGGPRRLESTDRL
jgi:hypothetical protein